MSQPYASPFCTSSILLVIIYQIFSAAETWGLRVKDGSKQFLLVFLHALTHGPIPIWPTPASSHSQPCLRQTPTIHT